uniref:Uncharacterized protein n=1 Tax=Trypanosoma congolense (strain IL3000) TaxID=1068625 RepID=G0UTZ1_TRYCI|nr:hypothetical protein TCIL3000_9_2520 [Trypanosoma congolense IL3000]
MVGAAESHLSVTRQHGIAHTCIVQKIMTVSVIRHERKFKAKARHVIFTQYISFLCDFFLLPGSLPFSCIYGTAAESVEQNPSKKKKRYPSDSCHFPVFPSSHHLSFSSQTFLKIFCSPSVTSSPQPIVSLSFSFPSIHRSLITAVTCAGPLTPHQVIIVN